MFSFLQKKHLLGVVALLSVASISLHAQDSSTQTVFNFSTAKRGPVIGPLHYGIFYEEINHAGDGGIYAELIRNGSMEENSSNPDYWWTIGSASFSISTSNLLNGAQTKSMCLKFSKKGDGTRNIGYWGINIVKGETYKASFWIRTANNWKGNLTLTLESYEGNDLGSTVLSIADEDGAWHKYETEITATGSYQLGWFAIRGNKAGTVYLDCISLFPPTYKNRENGMRRDLAEKLEALHPRFMRFPGGCYIEGGNRYQWKHTVGPVEERLGLYNSHWGYVVTNGMGFHEFLQLSEDLGAEPLFVVNIGIGHGWYEDYQHIEGYIQEALDALEYANGDVTTYWGAKRAEAGHPEPFNLRLIEIGNENYNFNMSSNSDQSDHYPERYKQFYDAIKAKYPDVICIGNVESWGTDNPSWRNQYPVDMVDEHYYRSPDWFAGMYNKYDNYSRTSNKIYVGEYAVTSDFGTNGTLKAALGEAIYMAGMERNSDVVNMASYAPIFVNENEINWRPDMIRYNAYTSFGTPSYWTQQMMAQTVGHQNITWEESNNKTSVEECSFGLGSWGTDATYSNIKVTDNEGNILYQTDEVVNSPASTYGTSKVFNDITLTDYTLELDAVKNSGAEGFLITFAYADGNNYAWWNLGGWNNGQHGVEQAINGSKSTLSSTSGSIETGQTYHIKIVRTGQTAKCYLDDKLIHTVTLSYEGGQRLFACASLNEAEDSAIVKIINYSGDAIDTRLQFEDAEINGDSKLRIMTSTSNAAENNMQSPLNVKPEESVINAPATTSHIDITIPGYSLSVYQIPLRNVSPEQVITPTELPQAAFEMDFETETGECKENAEIVSMTDDNHTLYTGDNTESKSYLYMGNDNARKIAEILNTNNWTASINILIKDGGNFNSFCWAWTVANSSMNYYGLINRANNIDWYFEKYADTQNHVRSRSGLSHNEWHNITVSQNDTEMAIYVDGQLRATGSPNSNSINISNTTYAWIGRSPYSADAYMTNTCFDDFRIYNESLSLSSAVALYNETKSKSTDIITDEPSDPEPNEAAVEIIGDNTMVDITSLMINPDFAQKTEGWEGTSLTAAPGTVAEQFYKLFDTFQILQNMPAGTYRLMWQGFYRDGNTANAYLRHTNGTEEMNAEVYVSKCPASEHLESQAAMKWTDVGSQPMLSLYIDNSYTYSPYTYPDNVTDANTAFTDGKYASSLDFIVNDISDLRIGLRKMKVCVYDWACFDNFKLYYLSPNTDLTIIESIPSTVGLSTNEVYFDLQGRQVKNPIRGIYINNGQKVLIK